MGVKTWQPLWCSWSLSEDRKWSCLFLLWSRCYFHPLNPPKGQSLRRDPCLVLENRRCLQLVRCLLLLPCWKIPSYAINGAAVYEWFHTQWLRERCLPIVCDVAEIKCRLNAGWESALFSHDTVPLRVLSAPDLCSDWLSSLWRECRWDVNLGVVNTDQIVKSSHKHGIYCITRNVTEPDEIRMNKSSEKTIITSRQSSSYDINVLL